VNRLGQQNSNDAECAIGAAWVLDSPSSGYLPKFIKEFHTYPGGSNIPQLDEEEIERAVDAFDSACKAHCLELAAAATKIEPANAEWWRLRAILLWRHAAFVNDDTPRDSNWPELLEEFSRHDPDNALYDYLAAYFYWQSSAEIDFSGNADRLLIKNPEVFARGIDCFERGQKKSIFVIGDAGFPATAKFLRLTDTPLIDHPTIVNSRGIFYRKSILLRDVARWQWLRAEAEAADGDFATALALHGGNVNLYRQFAAAGRSAAYDNILTACRAATTSQLIDLGRKFQDSLSAEELHEIEAVCHQARIDKQVVDLAAQSLSSGNAQQKAGLRVNSDPWAIALGFSISALLSSAFSLGLVAGISALLTLCSGSELSTRVGVAELALLMLAAIGLTVTLCGLAPAGIISEQVQAWGLTIAVIALPVAFLTWAAWSWYRPSSFKYSLRSLFFLTFVVSLLLTLVALARPVVVSFATFPFQLQIPALGSGGWSAELLESIFRPLGNWMWAIYQWTVYSGPFLTVAIWVCFAAKLLQLKFQFAQRKNDETLPSFRDRLRAFGRSLTLPSLALSAMAIILYFLLFPKFVRDAERHFQSEMAFARNPDTHWQRVENAVQEVRGDPATMSEITDAARVDFSGDKEEESE
jgi:hypothetical protein